MSGHALTLISSPAAVSVFLGLLLRRTLLVLCLNLLWGPTLCILRTICMFILSLMLKVWWTSCLSMDHDLNSGCACVSVCVSVGLCKHLLPSSATAFDQCADFIIMMLVMIYLGVFIRFLAKCSPCSAGLWGVILALQACPPVFAPAPSFFIKIKISLFSVSFFFDFSIFLISCIFLFFNCFDFSILFCHFFDCC